jgi:hypothetical protein
MADTVAVAKGPQNALPCPPFSALESNFESRAWLQNVGSERMSVVLLSFYFAVWLISFNRHTLMLIYDSRPHFWL